MHNNEWMNDSMIILCDGIDIKDSNNLEGWWGKNIYMYIELQGLSQKGFYLLKLLISMFIFQK